MKDMIDFKKDLRDTVAEWLQLYGIRYKESASLRELLIKWYTFLDKYILPGKRTVHVSEELSAKLPSLPAPVQTAFQKMAGWLEEGTDINCFQSRGLYGQGSRDYQNMVYGFIHLHLSAKEQDTLPVIKRDGFAKPGKYLLYGCIKEDDAYLIDIGEHPEALKKGKNLPVDWLGRRLLVIFRRNWPELLEDRMLRGVMPCDSRGNRINLNDGELTSLITGHVNTLVDVDDAYYLPGFGVTTSGDSVQAVLRADRSIRRASLAQIHYEKNPEFIHQKFREILERNGRPVPVAFDIHYDYIEILGKSAALDRISKSAWDYDSGTLYLFGEKEQRTMSR